MQLLNYAAGEARRSIDTMGNLWAELLVVWVGHCQLTDGTYSPSLKTTNLWLLLQPFWGGSLTATAIAWLVTTPGRLARSDPILWQLWESNSGNGLCSHATMDWELVSQARVCPRNYLGTKLMPRP